MFKKLLLTIVMFLAGINFVYAQAVTTNTPAVSITGTISTAINDINVPVDVTKIQNSGLAVNVGWWYNWKDKVADIDYFYPVFGTMKIGTWGQWEYVNIGYASPSVLTAGTGLVVNAGVVAQKWGLKLSSTVQTALNNTSIGFTPTIGLEKIGGKNEFTGGPGIYVKIGF